MTRLPTSKQLLVDTQILIWAALGEGLTPNTKKILEETDELFVSSISILEIKIKQAVNKLAYFDVSDQVNQLNAVVLDYSADHAEKYRIFNPKNRDPFDNAIIATALAETIDLLSSDLSILDTPIKGVRTINARQ